MNKKRVIAVISVIVIVIAIVSLYKTFATSSTIGNIDTTDDVTYSISLGDSSTVTVPAYSSKTIYYKLTSTNNGIVRYGISYSGTNIVVKEWDDSNDPVSGTINYMENKFIKLYVKNNGSVSSTATISAILGYENDENLIVPSGAQLVNTKVANLAEYISGLYNPNATETLNNVTYNLDTTNQFLEDKDGGIRYFGAAPSNYIKFNCTTYPETECETWRIIGVFDNKVKLIKNSLLGNFSWDYADGAYSNNWTTATLKVLLNEPYLDNLDTTYSNYFSSGVETIDVKFNTDGYGIKANTQGFISEFNYPLGGTSSTRDGYVDFYYDGERGDVVYGDNKKEWLGKIALPYVSDYGYASDIRSCKQILTSYNTSGCYDTNWMYTVFGTETAFLNVGSDLSTHEFIVYNGQKGRDRTWAAVDIFPVLYLNSNVVMELSGNGLENSPYKIA